ncbi:MAG: methyltransferase domain-containing protein [Bacilli bacterium]|nr:methyltransferase domain-containing protein [Bacilli bacterium]
MFFEHGSTENNNGGGSIDHAHLHCLPYNNSINQSVSTTLNKSPINLNILRNDEYNKNKSYIYLEEYNKSYLYDVENLPSQFLRKLISDNSSQSEYKWQNLSLDDINNKIFVETLNDLKSIFENNDNVVSYSSTWDNIHSNYTSEYDNFLEEYLKLIDKNSKIIELGCGAAYNSIELLKLGYKDIIATDFSEYIISKLNANNPNLKTMVFDMTKQFPLRDNEFNIVIVDLSIHYFDDVTTKTILKEIDRILVKGGYIIGRVDSTSNYQKNSKNIELERNYYFNGEYCKRYFDISDFDKYFNEFEKISLKENIMSRYENEKVVWEFVYRKREVMIDTGYLYSDDKSRLFINTSLGCTGGCAYCYLPKLGYSNNKVCSKTLTSDEILIEIEKSNFELTKDTLISFGCFSECWDNTNINHTKKLIEYFLKNGNQIQLSTKKEILADDIKELAKHIKYNGQLVILISNSTISNWKEIEKNTDSPDKRFNTFDNLKEFNIPIVLYIKPVLVNTTIIDLELYKKIINNYNIKDVVVGSIFKDTESEKFIKFSKDKKFFYSQTQDDITIIEALKGICNVYERSIEVMKKYKK